MDERPLECSSCKRKALIVYKEIAGRKIVSTAMCSECPMLKEKLGNPIDPENLTADEKIKGLNCEGCQTPFTKILTGEGMGCPKCYKSFEEPLIEELGGLQAIPINPESSWVKKKKISLHLGKSPVKGDKKGDTDRLESLHVALGEALTIENYELAANLRDQIKTLMGEAGGE